MSEQKKLDEIRKRIAEHKDTEPECHEHYEFEDIKTLLDMLDLQKKYDALLDLVTKAYERYTISAAEKIDRDIISQAKEVKE